MARGWRGKNDSRCIENKQRSKARCQPAYVAESSLYQSRCSRPQPTNSAPKLSLPQMATP
jgi:hypothetical protein